MKLLAFALLISTSTVFAQSYTNRYTKLAQQAGTMTDLHYCVLMSDGVELSYGINGVIWKGLKCNDVIKTAKNLDITQMEIEEQIIESLQLSTIYKLEDCAKENLIKRVKSCEELKVRAKKLGLSKNDIQTELGFLTSYL
jgi:hypothetical protein